jgi:hypothetical protein
MQQYASPDALVRLQARPMPSAGQASPFVQVAREVVIMMIGNRRARVWA